MRYIKQISFFIFNFSFLIFISGCAVKSNLPLDVCPLPKLPGITHIVQKGETLWRISKLYDVDLERIILANSITDKTRIASGQSLVIPGAKKKTSQYDDNPVVYDNSNFIWPVKGEIISYFTDKDEHLISKGITIKSNIGTSIACSRSGVVSFCADNLKGYGKIIIVDHADGFSSIYAYNSQNLVKLNEKITQGAIIAKVGVNEKLQKPALLFQIRKGITAQNPLYYLP